MPAESDDFILRGRVLTFFRAPTTEQDRDCYGYWEDGAIAVSHGGIVWRGDFDALPGAYANWRVEDHSGQLLLPGFIDTHTHFPQTQVIASHGAQLLDWLNQYTFPLEARFCDPEHCAKYADIFLDILIDHGVTTAAVYCTSDPTSVNAFFSRAEIRGMRMIAGKTLMDRGAPSNICDTPQRAHDETTELIEAWQGRGRMSYAITPRFALTSTPEQLDVVRALREGHPDCYLQTHLSENTSEVEAARALFPEAVDYLDVYDRYGLLGPRALFGHAIHLSSRERARLAESRSVAVFCPSSNLFLGSGLFDISATQAAGVAMGLGSDVGAGTSYSMLATAADAYKVCQMSGHNLSPLATFFMLTLGNARALDLETKIGTLEPGSEADVIVLDPRAGSREVAVRMDAAETLEEELFILQTLGDDRSIIETYIAGKPLKQVR